jgi:AcrR family transcriptional regulator
VIDAGVALVAEGGMEAFSVEAVAARSGVAKTTIYRHWPTRRQLLNAVFDSFEAHTPTPDTGSLRGDLDFLLHRLRGELATGDWAKSLTAIVAEGEYDRDLAEEHVAHARNEMRPWYEVLRRAQERGEIERRLDLDLVVEHVVGALFMRRLVLHGTNTKKEVDRLVDLVLTGLSKETP